MFVHVERVVRVVKRSLLAGKLEVFLHWSLKRSPDNVKELVYLGISFNCEVTQNTHCT